MTIRSTAIDRGPEVSAQEHRRAGAGDPEDEELFDPGDDSDLGLADLGDERIGLDAEEGPAEGIEDDDPRAQDDEDVRWSEGSEEAGDAIGDEDDDAALGQGQESGWVEGNDPDPDLDAGLEEVPELSELSPDDRGEEGLEDDAELDIAEISGLPALDADDPEAPGPDELSFGDFAPTPDEPEPIPIAGSVRWGPLPGVRVEVLPEVPRPPSVPPDPARWAGLPPRGADADAPLWARAGIDGPVYAAWPGHGLYHRDGEGPWLPKPSVRGVRAVAAAPSGAVAAVCQDGVRVALERSSAFESIPLAGVEGALRGVGVGEGEVWVVTDAGVYRRRGAGFYRIADLPLWPVAAVREGPICALYGCVVNDAGELVVARVEALTVRRPVQVVLVHPGVPPATLQGWRGDGQTHLLLRGADAQLELLLRPSVEDDED